jgi:hypothetical protein
MDTVYICYSDGTNAMATKIVATLVGVVVFLRDAES